MYVVMIADSIVKLIRDNYNIEIDVTSKKVKINGVDNFYKKEEHLSNRVYRKIVSGDLKGMNFYLQDGEYYLEDYYLKYIEKDDNNLLLFNTLEYKTLVELDRSKRKIVQAGLFNSTNELLQNVIN